VTELLVGCPVYKRDWILPHWLVNVEAAARRLGVVPSYVFVGDPNDKATIEVVETCRELYCEDRVVRFVWFAEEEEREDDARVWNALRYHRMVELRNALLRTVRLMRPNWFLSLDSDILLHPQTLLDLYESSANFDAVGGKAFLSLGTVCPTWANLAPLGGLQRQNADGVFPVDVIMAIKLMNERAYNVDYRWHEQGEDAGWGIACREAGVRLGWDGRTANKHVMERDQLFAVDKRCGY
jgi:hypothetical protein